jgi:hypothetical protein
MDHEDDDDDDDDDDEGTCRECKWFHIALELGASGDLRTSCR